MLDVVTDDVNDLERQEQQGNLSQNGRRKTRFTARHSMLKGTDFVEKPS